MRDDLRIDWAVPQTGSGWSGRLERFMGPGKTRAESMVEVAGGAICVALLAWLVWRTGTHRSWSVVQSVVVAVVAIDLVGGVLTNSTNAAKRWYHREAPGTSRSRLTFVGLHVLHLAAVAFLVLPGDWRWMASNAALLLLGAVLIEYTPLEIKRPTAMAAYLAVLAVNFALFPLPAALAWFTSFFFLKLLVCHLVPEAPMVARHGD